MPTDVQLLETHSSYTDPAAGITERFVGLSLGSGHTLGVLSTPIGEQQPVGWVLCHSFAREQVDLMVADAAIARRVAAAGFPVLRFHCQGYGDSEHPEHPVSVSTHLRDAMDAVGALRSLVDVAQVGTIGTRFGAAVAALAADRMGLHHLIMVAPVTNGGRYMNELIRGLAMTQVATSAQGSMSNAPTGEVLRSVLNDRGFLDYKGMALTKEIMQENSAMDLLKDLKAFDGRALLMQISVTDKPQASLQRLAAVFERLSASVGRATVLHRQAALFGQKHILITGEATNEDLFAELHREVAGAVVEWLETPAGAGPFTTVRDAGDSLSRGRTHIDPEEDE